MSDTTTIEDESPEEIAKRIAETTRFIATIEKRLSGEMAETMIRPVGIWLGNHETYSHTVPDAFLPTILAGLKSMLEQCRSGDAENLIARCGGAPGNAFEVKLMVGAEGDAPAADEWDHIERAVEESIR